jgi:spermidine synthase
MAEKKRVRAPVPPLSSPRFLPGLFLLFVGSGCAALVYEVVWFQLLELVIGATAVSLGVLLATFMGGMCAGSLLLPRLVDVDRHPLRVYAWLELGIAAMGILILVGLPLLGNLYVASVGYGFLGILFRGLLCAVCLLPPTLLMGATLPAIARWVEATPQGVSWLGFFYGGNIAGAVFGCLLAGFYLLRVYDMARATLVAAALNVAVALVALLLARSTGYARTDASAKDAPRVARGAWPVYVVIALSGLAALGAEVVWTRILSLLLGGTVYTFSIILGAFLAGLGLGSSVGAWLARATERPGLLLAACQVGAMISIAWAALLLNRAFPYWPIDPSLSAGPWFTLQLDLVRAAMAIVPAAFFWGASFPLALATVASRGQDAGRLVGGIYAANTVGAIVGSLLFSLLLISGAGSQNAQRWLIVIATAAALWMVLWRAPSETKSLATGRRLATAAALLLLALIAATSVAPVPPALIAYGRQIASPTALATSYLYTGEGLNSSIAVSEQEGGVRNFHVSGKVEASSEVHDMRLQRLLGHMSALMHPNPRTVLVVGFGAGVTAGSFLLHPTVERIVICEIEPLIPQVVSRYFSAENHDVLNDPRVEVIYDDARHYILTTGEKFDVITSDPIHPWVKGAASLYTKEYFELVKSHLNPGGVITQWVPLYESTLDVVKSEIATFFDVFPFGTIWSNEYVNGDGYDIVLLAKSEPLTIDPGALQARLDRPDHATIAAELNQVEFVGVPGLLATYGGQARDLGPWLAGAEINYDRNLRLQYLAGMGNNVYDNRIYQSMLAYRRFPAELFAGTEEWRERLRQVVARARTNNEGQGTGGP